jgi:hypothetical protein
MPLQRLGFCARLALCLACTATPGLAEPVAAPSEQPGARAAPGEQAVVVLVGAAGRDPELRALLLELLAREGVRARLVAQASFGRQELLRAAPSGGAVHVFVVPGLTGHVGLYFRAPDGERFLLRSVLLRAGFDDMGREQVGQIVETAVVSLLHSGDGLTREQAQLALANQNENAGDAPEAAAPDAAAAAAKPPPPPQPEAKPSSAPQRVRARHSDRALEGWLALRYGAAELGPGLGLAHGPGLELGLGVSHGWLLRGRLIGERDFAQTFTSSSIAAEITSVRLRFGADAGLVLAPGHALLVSFGIGQDRSDVKPESAPGSTVTPAAAFVDTAPVAHAELRYELGGGAFRVAAALGADASLVETHYDVARKTATERVVRPWLVRPGGSLALAFCPRWATF